MARSFDLVTSLELELRVRSVWGWVHVEDFNILKLYLKILDTHSLYFI